MEICNKSAKLVYTIEYVKTFEQEKQTNVWLGGSGSIVGTEQTFNDIYEVINNFFV